MQTTVEGYAMENEGSTVGKLQSPKPNGSSYFRLPHQLPPSQDLMALARTAILPDSPFDTDPQYGALFDQLFRALYSHFPRHVLLVGERGVGQTSVLAEMARQVVVGRAPFLSSAKLLLVDARHTAPEESREHLLGILSHVAGQSETIVFLEGFATLLEGPYGLTNKSVLLATMPHVRCRLVGLVSPHEYERLAADDHDVQEHFTAVFLHEPSIATAIKLLERYAAGLEAQYSVKIHRETVRQAVILSAHYIFHDRLPHKALKVLTQVCHRLDYDRSQLGIQQSEVTVDAVVNAVARVSGLPKETLSGVSERCDYEQCLGNEIVGQDHAVRAAASELGLIKAGLTDPGKPASVMLFVGQTGTGKTEMAKALARIYSTSKRLRIYPLANFGEPHSVSGLIGVPPGYVGHEQGGRLVTDLNADPYGVFLLDEADKAHPDVLQPFLHLFDEGSIRDQRGVVAYADKSIFVLTTNVGQRMIADMTKQGKTAEEIAVRIKDTLAQIRHSKSNRPVFPPEFLARIKRVLVFQSLDRPAMEGIGRKLLANMQHMWEEKRQKKLLVGDDLIGHIAHEADRLNQKAEGREGGRIVRKLMSDLIDIPIREEIARQPEKYRSCEAVVLTCNAETQGKEDQAPSTAVDFRQPKTV